VEDLIKNFVTDLVKEWSKHIEKEKRKRMRRLTQEEFINKCLEIHGNKYDYSKTVYVNTRTNITIVCKEHGEFTMKPDNHSGQKQGCVKCVLKNHKLVEISKERLEGLKIIHDSKYDYNDLSVNSGYINITCKEHGIFRQSIYIHERGHGCPECNSSSRGENKIKSILEKNKIEFHRNYKFDDCVRTKKLRFDFYLPKLNLIIEYDGEHHYKENKYFGEGNLEYMKENDRIKNQYCIDKNIKLIRIPYWDLSKIEEILSF
jgi:hypothetical protein